MYQCLRLLRYHSLFYCTKAWYTVRNLVLPHVDAAAKSLLHIIEHFFRTQTARAKNCHLIRRTPSRSS